MHTKLRDWFRDFVTFHGDNPDRDAIRDTPDRMSHAMFELFAGYKENPAEHFGVLFHEPTAVDPIEMTFPFYSLCEHHVLPFWGEVTLRYMPRNGKIVGLSKVPRGVRALAARLQTQERLTVEIADAFFAAVGPVFVVVTLDASHMCVSARGIESPAKTKTTTRRGAA